VFKGSPVETHQLMWVVERKPRTKLRSDSPVHTEIRAKETN